MCSITALISTQPNQSIDSHENDRNQLLNSVVSDLTLTELISFGMLKSHYLLVLF